jgi:hypothetical protein
LGDWRVIPSTAFHKVIDIEENFHLFFLNELLNNIKMEAIILDVLGDLDYYLDDQDDLQAV